MKSLIIIAHGSRREESNREIIEMVTRINMQLEAGYDHVSHAFLEICNPSLHDAVAQVIEMGAREVSVYPFFLNSGNHVQRDIPEMIQALNASYPDCEIRLMPHFGQQEDIASLIARHVSRS